jgi:hypothetical protein
MNIIYSLILFIGTLIGSMNGMPIYQPHNNQINIDHNPAIVITKPTQPSASIYILDNDNQAIAPPAPPPAPPGPIEDKNKIEYILYEPLELVPVITE